MAEGIVQKKWQNLARRACPLCGGPLEPMPFHGNLFRCMKDDECDFVISCSSILRILNDETHILRLHLTPEEKIRLENTVRAMTEGIDDGGTENN